MSNIVNLLLDLFIAGEVDFQKECTKLRHEAVEWLDDKVKVLDQSRLPHEKVYLELSSHLEVAQAIKEMKVRGAPTIGVIAAYGMALGAQDIKASDKNTFLAELKQIKEALESTRPTAVNLFQAIERMTERAQTEEDVIRIKAALIAEAKAIHISEEQATKQISQLGAEFIKSDSSILTHCNAGALATSGYGTALGIVKAAKDQGKVIRVFATETRPLLQGARLTTWEMMQDDVPITLITDSMAGHFMNRGEVSCVIVGADRIAANGDVANKIGTYTLAVLAKENRIPFYVAAPTTTIDLSLSSGKKTTIEYRDPREVTHIQGVRVAPEGLMVANPAFDVTPQHYVSAIITERGVAKGSYKERLEKLCKH